MLKNPYFFHFYAIYIYKKTNFIAPFYGWGSTASRLEPLRGGSLLFTTKFPEIIIVLTAMTNALYIWSLVISAKCNM